MSVFKLGNGQILRDVVDVFSKLSNEVFIEICKDGFVFKLLTKDTTQFIEVIIKRGAFIEYDDNVNQVICLSLKSLGKIKNMKECNVIFDFGDDFSLLKLSLVGKKKANYNLRLIDLTDDYEGTDSYSKKLGDFKEHYTANIAVDSFSDAHSSLLGTSDESFSIIGYNDRIELKDNNEVGDFGSVSIPKSERCVIKKGDFKDGVKSMFSNEIISNAINILSKLFNKVDMSFGVEYPLRFKVNGNDLNFVYLIAPRIENEVDYTYEKEDKKEQVEKTTGKYD